MVNGYVNLPGELRVAFEDLIKHPGEQMIKPNAYKKLKELIDLNKPILSELTVTFNEAEVKTIFSLYPVKTEGDPLLAVFSTPVVVASGNGTINMVIYFFAITDEDVCISLMYYNTSI